MDTKKKPLSRSEKQALVDEEADRQRHIQMLRSVRVPSTKEHDWGQRIAIIIIVLLVATIGLGSFKLFFHSKKVSANAAKNQAHTTSKNSSSATTINTNTKSFASNDFNLSFIYPIGWDVVDSGSGPMTVTSPGLKLIDASGHQVIGLITMTIQKQGQLPASFSAGNDLAVLDSQTINYSQPTSSQPSQTYLSFVQYSSTITLGGLDGIYVTGNDGYQKEQSIPEGDIAGISPLVTISFTKCGNAKCTSNLTPLTISSASWTKSSYQKPISNMLASLAFQ